MAQMQKNLGSPEEMMPQVVEENPHGLLRELRANPFPSFLLEAQVEQLFEDDLAADLTPCDAGG